MQPPRWPRHLLWIPALVLGFATPGSAYQTPEFLFTFGAQPAILPGMLNYPTLLAVNSTTGDVYVQDLTGRLQRFDRDGNFLNQWTCSACIGVGVNDVTGDVYAAAPNLNEVRQFTANGSFIREWGSFGSGDGEFDFPFDVDVDPLTGNVYVRDSGNGRIQVFDGGGSFLFKFGTAGFGPGQFEPNVLTASVDFDPVTRRVYASDPNRPRIQAFDEFGNFLLLWGGVRGNGPGEMRWPRDVTGNGTTVYVADTDNERIQVFDSSGNFVATLQGPHNLVDGPQHPRGIAVNRTTGEKYVNAAYAHRVDRFDANDNYEFSWGYWPRDGLDLRFPNSVAASPTTGDVFVFDSNNFRLKRFKAGGQFLNEWGESLRIDPSLPGLFSFPDSALTVDASGNVWVGKTLIHYPGEASSFLQQFDPLGNVIGAWQRGAIGDFFNEDIADVAVDPATGRVYLSDRAAAEVQIYETSPVLALVDQIPLAGPAGLSIHDGYLYALAAVTDQVHKYTLDGTPVTQWGGAGSGTGQLDLGRWSKLTVDADGNVYVADSGNDRIQVFDTEGNFLDAFDSTGQGTQTMANPLGISFSQLHNVLYVVESSRHRVLAYSLGPACSDGRDNDGDGIADWPGDRSCLAASDQTEQSDCSDGFDNDGDALVDGDDPGCLNGASVREDPQCQDGLNNDPNQDPDPGLIDFDGGQWLHGACSGAPGGCPAGVSDPDGDGVADPDPQCTGRPWKDKEREGGPCGLGVELLLLGPLVWLARGRRVSGRGRPALPLRRHPGTRSR
ncbi:MAG: hypothetical protein QNK03_23450 [Myxococcota bacterium]|nr:hypothetical protein [Myxococcota bacterium]